MSNLDYNSLYEKFLAGNCSEEEKQLLESYFAEIKLMDNTWDKELGDEKLIRQSILSNITNLTDLSSATVMPRHRSYTWVGYAASVIILLGFGIYYFSSRPTAGFTQPTNIMPDRNQVCLTLADGTKVGLTGTDNSLINNTPGVTITKENDSVLIYSITKDHNASVAATGINKLSVPNGRTFQVLLSDGTKVWMNAASSISYPAVFTGNERKVTLTGEAYFEVAKNKEKPFHVSINGMDVEVLGTHFNVIGYKADDEVKTTLLEGSVRLNSSTGNALLKPGQQGVYSSTRRGFAISKINTEDVIAWKDGFFVFNNESLQTIMQKIARWYDVEVVFRNKKAPNNFGGTISKYKSIDIVLKTLEATGSVHFKIEKGRVIVTD